jgi:hypothetical protein
MELGIAMKKFLLATAVGLFMPTIAHAQCTGIFPTNTVCGNSSGSPAPPGPAAPGAFVGVVTAQVPQFPTSVTNLGASTDTNTRCAQSGGGVTPYWGDCGSAIHNLLRNSSLIDSRCTPNGWGTGNSCSKTITTSGDFCAVGVYVIPVGASVTCIWHAPGDGAQPGLAIAGGVGLTDLRIRFVQDSWTVRQFVAPTQYRNTPTFTFQMRIFNNSAVMNPTIATFTPTALDNFSTTFADLTPAQPTQSCPTSLSGINSYNCTIAFTWTTGGGIATGYEEVIDLHPTDNLSGGITILPGFDMRVTPGATPGIALNPPTPDIPDPYVDHIRDQRHYQVYTNWQAVGFTELGWSQATNTTTVTMPFPFPVMRAPPTVGCGGLRVGGNIGATCTGGSTTYSSTILTGGGGAISVTTGNMYITEGTVTLDAELTGG